MSFVTWHSLCTFNGCFYSEKNAESEGSQQYLEVLESLSNFTYLVSRANMRIRSGWWYP